jgi:tetratricopeptide (TPR) repeat protein
VADARWNGSPRDEIRALGLIATTRMRRGDRIHAATIMDRVLGYFLEHGSKSEQAWALRQRGNVDLVRSEYATAEVFYRRALELYRATKDTNNEGIVLSELAGVLWSRQDFEGAVAMIEQSITMRPKGSLGLASCYYNLGAVLNGMGKIAESREAAKMSLALFRKHERKDGEGQALSLLGELAQRSNEHAEAQQMLEQALALHRERGAIRETGITLGNLARVALDQGRFDDARKLAEEAVELHRECGNKYNESMQLLDCTDAAIGERRLDDAAAIVEQAIVPVLAIENYPAIASAKCRRGFIAQARGDFAQAEAHYDESIADAKRGNYEEQIGWTQLYRAVIRAKQQRTSEARALLEEARTYLKDSVQGRDTLAMAEAVIEQRPLPAPRNFDARLIAILGA